MLLTVWNIATWIKSETFRKKEFKFSILSILIQSQLKSALELVSMT